MQQQVITLTPKQSNVFVYGWQPEARHRIAVCGRRFGKTFLCMREIKRAVKLAAKRGISTDNEIWYGAPTLKQAKRVFWSRLKRSLPPHWIDGKPNETECSIRMKSGHMVRIVGLDNYDNLRGSGLFFFVGDEWADAKPECWSEVIQPMLATCKGHSLRIGTPKGFDGLYDAFQMGQPGAVDGDGKLIGDYRSWQYTTLQGGNVDPDEIAAARRDLDARTFEQEYNATFMNYEGRVLHAFTRQNSVKPCPLDPRLPLHVGMDFNISPMSATVWQEADGVSRQVDEIVIPTSNTDEMVAEIKRRYPRPETGRWDHVLVYPDPAGAQRRTSAQGRTDIGILQAAGFKVIAMSSHPLVRDRINVTNGRFHNAAGEHHAFVDPKCKKSITAYERHAYKEGTNEPDKEGGFDHLCDATGYYMFTRFGGNAVKLVKITGF